MFKVKKYVKRFIYVIFEASLRKERKTNTNDEKSFKQEINKDIVFNNIERINIQDKRKFKCVGAVNYNEYVYFVPNSVNSIMKLNTNDNEYKIINFSDDDKKEFKWTGGCLFENKIYYFPRSSNKIIEVDPISDEVKFIELDIKYNKEHHYGGVLTEKGIIYQPPRNNNTILCIDLNTKRSKEIKISPKFLKYNYISGKLHPNGLIYFLPEKNERVLVFNPQNERFWFIGKRLDAMTFDVALAINGNLYGFSGYCNGILKIDISKNKAEMICKEIGNPGAYGSKVALNGKIYNIPGNGNIIYEFDPLLEKCIEIDTIDTNNKLKYAGGTLDIHGNIVCAPIDENNILIYKFKNAMEKQFNILDFPYRDNY